MLLKKTVFLYSVSKIEILVQRYTISAYRKFLTFVVLFDKYKNDV